MISKFGILVVAVLACSANALPPCTCTRNYTPVCGTDGQTYSNECMMECAEQTKARDGPCEVTAPVSCICTLEYNPTCGSDGHTHPNPCTARCSGGVAHLGPCQSEQPQPKQPQCTCNKMKKPVCGSDGKTYSNDCLLNCATIENSRLSIAYFGPCTAGEGTVHVVDNVQPESVHVVDDFKVEPIKVAPNWNDCTCTRNLNPVCGADGVTYSNECMLRCAGAEMAKEGSCDGGLEREHQVVVEE